ncbi:hypothetical protein AGMMS49944_28400 [Spirochaetia bacterium]|nr:hypothetical protein AGMMS49944_28400 [Spirochaetia bacterium]
MVEQASHVKLGNEYLKDDILTFTENLENIQKADVLILSSVIQYCKEPHQVLDMIVDKNIKYIIIDRSGDIWQNENPEICRLQYAKNYGYAPTIYPRWFLNWKLFYAHFEKKYKLRDYFASGRDMHLNINGFVFEKKETNQ